MPVLYRKNVLDKSVKLEKNEGEMQKNGGLTFLAGITQTIGGVTAVDICSAEGLLSNISLGGRRAGDIEVIGWCVLLDGKRWVEERPLHTPSVTGRQASGGGRLTTLPADRLAERAAESLGGAAAAEAGVRSGATISGKNVPICSFCATIRL